METTNQTCIYLKLRAYLLLGMQNGLEISPWCNFAGWTVSYGQK